MKTALSQGALLPDRVSSSHRPTYQASRSLTLNFTVPVWPVIAPRSCSRSLRSYKHTQWVPKRGFEPLKCHRWKKWRNSNHFGRSLSRVKYWGLSKTIVIVWEFAPRAWCVRCPYGYRLAPIHPWKVYGLIRPYHFCLYIWAAYLLSSNTRPLFGCARRAFVMGSIEELCS